jgi:hypothetical protein
LASSFQQHLRSHFQKLFRKSFSKSYLETLLEIFAMRAAETRLESVGESLFKEPFEIALAKMLPAILRSNAGGRHAAETGAGSEGRRIMRNADQQLKERRAGTKSEWMRKRRWEEAR